MDDRPSDIAILAIKCEAQRELDTTDDDEYADPNHRTHETEEEFIDEHYLDDPDEVPTEQSVPINRPTCDDADVDAHSNCATDVLDDEESKCDVDQFSIHIDVESTIADEDTANRISQFDPDSDGHPNHEDADPAGERTLSRANTKFVYDGDEDDELEMLVEYIDDDIAEMAGDDSDENGGDRLSADLSSLVEGLPNIVPDVVRVTRNGKVVEAFECPECDEIVLTARSFEQHVQ